MSSGKFDIKTKIEETKLKLQGKLKDNFDEPYFNQIVEEVKKEISIDELCQHIQPLINKEGQGETLTPKETIEYMLYLLKYAADGLDLDYWRSGAGAPGNCVIS